MLAHQAVVDRSWDAAIVPELKRRFPTTGDDLTRAKAFAYGGSHIADLGYFPLGSTLFTELVHYVRSGAFVTALVRSARTVDEYAFALGALGHYVADTVGHPEATNRVVPTLYPKLQRKFGDRVTYADDHASHLQTEFRFDVFEMAQNKASRDLFHHAVQFEVPTRVLGEAFERTYGIRLEELFTNVDAAILTYRWAFRGLIHEATGIAWALYQADIQKLDPEMTPAGFVYDLTRDDFEHEFGRAYAEPGYFARFLAFFVKLVPNVGPLKRAIYKPLPPEAQQTFRSALDDAVARYQREIKRLGRKSATLADLNLDTGTPVDPRDYEPAEDALTELAELTAPDTSRRPGSGPAR